MSRGLLAAATGLPAGLLLKALLPSCTNALGACRWPSCQGRNAPPGCCRVSSATGAHILDAYAERLPNKLHPDDVKYLLTHLRGGTPGDRRDSADGPQASGSTVGSVTSATSSAFFGRRHHGPGRRHEERSQERGVCGSGETRGGSSGGPAGAWRSVGGSAGKASGGSNDASYRDLEYDHLHNVIFEPLRPLGHNRHNRSSEHYGSKHHHRQRLHPTGTQHVRVELHQQYDDDDAEEAEDTRGSGPGHHSYHRGGRNYGNSGAGAASERHAGDWASSYASRQGGAAYGSQQQTMGAWSYSGTQMGQGARSPSGRDGGSEGRTASFDPRRSYSGKKPQHAQQQRPQDARQRREAEEASDRQERRSTGSGSGSRSWQQKHHNSSDTSTAWRQQEQEQQQPRGGRGVEWFKRRWPGHYVDYEVYEEMWRQDEEEEREAAGWGRGRRQGGGKHYSSAFDDGDGDWYSHFYSSGEAERFTSGWWQRFQARTGTSFNTSGTSGKSSSTSDGTGSYSYYQHFQRPGPGSGQGSGQQQQRQPQAGGRVHSPELRAHMVVLGLDAAGSVDAAAVKAAFRVRALETHPDLHQAAGKAGKAAAEERFRAVQRAYQELCLAVGSG